MRVSGAEDKMAERQICRKNIPQTLNETELMTSHRQDSAGIMFVVDLIRVEISHPVQKCYNKRTETDYKTEVQLNKCNSAAVIITLSNINIEQN